MKTSFKRNILILCVISFILTLGAPFASAAETGTTTPVERAQLPEPVFYEKNYLVDLYWFAWEKAWDHVHYDPGAPQSPFMDEAFSDGNIWIWDTCFMTLFCRYAHDLFPGAQSLLNFYAPMHDGVFNHPIHLASGQSAAFCLGGMGELQVHRRQKPPDLAASDQTIFTKTLCLV